MPAYVINDMRVTDPALLEEYKELSPATIARYGGRFLARGGRVETLEGAWEPERIVILEFPTFEQAKAWANSADYAPARCIRQRAATSRLVVTDGLPAVQT
jgi:uncharacterized protein (DUF1330 family)